MPIAPSSYRRRIKRTSSVDAPRGFWGLLVDRISRSEVLVQLALCLAASAVLLILLHGWTEPVPFHEGSVVPRGIVARVPFEKPDVDRTRAAQERAAAYVNVKKHGCRIGDLLFIGCYAQGQENGFAIVLPHATQKNKLIVKALGDGLASGIVPFKDILNAKKVKYDELFVHSRDGMPLFHNEFLGKAYGAQDQVYATFLDNDLLSASTQLDWTPYH